MDDKDFNLIKEKIKAAARERELDLNDPENEHTLWSDSGSYMQFSGSFGNDSHAAWSTGKHPPNQKLYVAKGPLHNFGISEVERCIENGNRYEKRSRR